MVFDPYLINSVEIFALAALVAWLVTPLSMRLGAYCGLVDRPNERRIHQQNIARSGGLALICGFFAGIAAVVLLWPHYRGGLGETWRLPFVCASVVLIAVGLYDDKFDLRPAIKLAGQLLAALLMYVLTQQSVGSIMGYALPGGVNAVLTLLWFVVFINAFNLIDGLDGLCAGITAISAMGLGFSFILRDMPGDSLVSFALAGSALGFLYYNFHPAKVFLGDTGSMFCGFCLAAMSLQTNGKSTLLVTAGIPVLAAGIPVIDTVLAIWRRSARSMLARSKGDHNANGLMNPDLEHLHHRLLALGLNQKQVATTLYLATAACVLIGLLSLLGSRNISFGLFLIIFTASVYVLVRHVVHVELWDTGKLLIHNIEQSARRGFVSMLVYPLWDLIWLALSLALAFWLLAKFTVKPFIVGKFLLQALIWLPGPYLALIAAKTYYKVWFHASTKDFLELMLALISGVLVSIAFAALLQQDISFKALITGALFCLFASFGIVGIRIIAPVFGEWMLTTQRPQHIKRQNVLLYGGGRRCGLFMRAQHLSCYQDTEHFRIAGIIDDAPFLRKRLIHGLQVIGGIEELETAVDALQIDRIIVTTELKASTFVRLKALAATKRIDLSGWRSRPYQL